MSFTASRPGAPVRKLNVSEDQAGLGAHRLAHRLLAGPRGRDDAMAEPLDDRLDIHGDDGFILDDEHIRRNARGDLARGLVDQLGSLVWGCS